MGLLCGLKTAKSVPIMAVFVRKRPKNDQKTTDERPENGRCSAIVNH